MEIRCVYTEGNQNVIQEAVDRLPSAGGTVIVPRGKWKSGAIHLKSNVKLYLEEGCPSAASASNPCAGAVAM